MAEGPELAEPERVVHKGRSLGERAEAEEAGGRGRSRTGALFVAFLLRS